MRGEQFIALGSALFLTGCGIFSPNEVVSDPDGPSSRAIMGEEIQTTGLNYENQVHKYDIQIEGELQTEQAQPLKIAFQLSGTADNETEAFELDGEIQIENLSDEEQSLVLLEPLPGESVDEYVVEVPPSQIFETDIQVTGSAEEGGTTYTFSSETIQEANQIRVNEASHFTKRITETFQAIGDHAGIVEKSGDETYTGTVYEQLDEILAAYWFNPYQMTQSDDTPQEPLNFELVVDAETKRALQLTITNEPKEDAAPKAVFRLELGNIEEKTPAQ